MEYLQRSYLGGEWEGQALWLWTQPIKTADNSITMNGQRTAKRDKILSQSVSQSDGVRCHFALTALPPFLSFSTGPTSDDGHLITPQRWSTPSRLCILLQRRRTRRRIKESCVVYHQSVSGRGRAFRLFPILSLVWDWTVQCLGVPMFPEVEYLFTAH